MNKTYKKSLITFLLPLLIFITSSILLVLALYSGWFGIERTGIMQFCEYNANGLIKQPANSFSNLAFSIVGLLIAWFTLKGLYTNNNLFNTQKRYPVFMSIILVLLGAGSFAMHASNTSFGGFLDLFAMFLVSSFVFCYALKRWLQLPDLLILFIFFIDVSICSYIYLSPFNNTLPYLTVAEYAFILNLVITVAIELYLYKKRNTSIKFSWGIAGTIIMLVAFAIWNISRTRNSLWCNPESLLQGHAVWHILNAVALYIFYRYYVSEENVTALST